MDQYRVGVKQTVDGETIDKLLIVYASSVEDAKAQIREDPFLIRITNPQRIIRKE